MILRKEPLFRKQLVILTAALIMVFCLFVLGELIVIRIVFDHPPAGLTALSLKLVIWSAGASLLAAALTASMFWGLWRSAIIRLERLSAVFDRITDGEPVMISADEEEGIISRLESQSCQMARRLQLTMENVNREKEDLKSLVTDISHQIKTPLASIKVFNSLLIDGGLSDKEVNEFLAREKEQIDKLEWLSASLIKISRMETGIIELKKETGDVKQTILDAVNEVYSKALTRDVEIDVCNLSSCLAAHDSKWTREAIVNILENSIKYVPEKGRIQISMERMETCLKIDIEDNGIGIPQHEINHIFDRFFRGESELIKNSEGTGIGLYLTRKIIEEQGGGIIAASDKDNGAKFSIIMVC